MKTKIFSLLFFVFFLTACQAQVKKGTQLVAPDAFEKTITENKGQLIDVRTPKEYNSGHLKGAKNLHLYDQDFSQRVDKLDKKQPVYVYCKAGGRSAEAVEILQQKGFQKIVELDGGMDAWNDSKKPVQK
ncbi:MULTISPECIES: rhodanese-like domain-containing protein [Flavobacterium]|uniref:rhodanese-like domain-containing protein n=1 Tax=Flavobacterium TaxID=237 RepID=UPI000969FDA8|nr:MULTISPECIES: rhodanese-like domain-containing protein [Flavobacterium]MBN9283887.1 rhodanese-like domain-containing protein [Flavobacterium sp.]OJV68615.1 MAG: hypothetical protein BGO42_01930 [Flavobacterium sp. 40-81]